MLVSKLYKQLYDSDEEKYTGAPVREFSNSIDRYVIIVSGGGVLHQIFSNHV